MQRSKLSESRGYSRFRTQLPVQFTASQLARSARGTVTIISADGMELHCDRANTLKLLPNGHKAVPDQQDEVNFEILWERPDTPNLDGRGRCLSSRRIAQNGYRLGFQYTELNPKAKALLQEFLDECTPAP